MGETGTCAVVAGLVGFALGAIVATLLTIFIPKLHRKLAPYRVRLRAKGTTAGPDEQTDNQAGTEKRKSNNYSEIDENKTRTFTPKKALIPVKDGRNVTVRYEDCIMDGKTHKYSDLGAADNVKVKKALTTDSYEPFAPGKHSNVKENRDSNHEYFILEPDSDKRLPVKMIEHKHETLACDPSHLYFILEPGTNKVTPVSHHLIENTSKRPKEGSTDRESGHIYFVLEPMTETDDTETLAYAVNDVSAGPTYFILEKTDHVY